MKTKQSAIKRGRQTMGDRLHFVYQFPAGHWACATLDSPVGQRLALDGFIYDGVPAQQMEVVAKESK